MGAIHVRVHDRDLAANAENRTRVVGEVQASRAGERVLDAIPGEGLGRLHRPEPLSLAV